VVLRVDGGAAAMNTLVQQQADQLGVPVARPRVAETTALGAAYLAGLAEGFWRSLDEITDNWQVDLEVQPGGDRAALDAAHDQWHRGVERARNWARE
jgi:glycerol kinase